MAPDGPRPPGGSGDLPDRPTYDHRDGSPGYLPIFEYYPEHDVAVALQVNAFSPYDTAEYAVRLGEAIVRSTDH